MEGLLVLLVAVYLCFRILKFWLCFIIVPVKKTKAIRITAIDYDKKKANNELSIRKNRALAFKRLLSKPMALKKYKELLKLEIEVKQTIKGIKRRTLSNIKYDKIKQSQKSGKMSQDLVDILNSQ